MRIPEDRPVEGVGPAAADYFTDLGPEVADIGAPPDDPVIGPVDGLSDQPELGPTEDTAPEAVGATGAWDSFGTSGAGAMLPAEKAVDIPPESEVPPLAKSATAQAIGDSALPVGHPSDAATAEASGDATEEPDEAAQAAAAKPGNTADSESSAPTADAASDSGSGNGPIDHSGETGEDDNGPHDAIPLRKETLRALESMKTPQDPDGSGVFMEALEGESIATDKSTREEQGHAVIYTSVEAWANHAKVGKYDKLVGTGIITEAVVASVQENGFFEDEVTEPPKPVTADQVADYVNQICDNNNTHLASRDPEKVRPADDPEAVQDLEELREKIIAYERERRDARQRTGLGPVPEKLEEAGRAFGAALTRADLANMEPTDELDERLRRLTYIERGYATAADTYGQDDYRTRAWLVTSDEAWENLGADWEHEAYLAEFMANPPPRMLVEEYTRKLAVLLAPRALLVGGPLDIREREVAQGAIGEALHNRGYRYSVDLVGKKQLPMPTLDEVKEIARKEVATYVELSKHENEEVKEAADKLARRVENWGEREI